MSNDFSTDSFEINEDVRDAIDVLFNSNRNVFITGSAGTGKSTLLRYFVKNIQNSTVVIAPTGVSALNVGGQTIHSFFRFSPDVTLDKIVIDKRLQSVIKKIDSIVIDEISMVRSDIFDCIDKSLRLHSLCDEPFGGKRLILFGDLFQLPPILKRDEMEIFLDIYNSQYFFDSKAYRVGNFSILELKKIYRQKNTKFINLLNRIRTATYIDEDLDLINKHVVKYNNTDVDNSSIYITTTNNKAEDINNKNLEKINGLEYIFNAEARGSIYEREFPANKVLKLKVGAKVMITVNDSPLKRYVNGTIGIIKSIDSIMNTIHIDINGKTVKLEKYEWKKYTYRFNEKSEKIEAEEVGSFVQFPILLAYAITIHKSQGKQFDNIILDTDRGIFATGQFYVAISRVKSLKGLKVVKKIQKKDIMTDRKILNFFKVYGN